MPTREKKSNQLLYLKEKMSSRFLVILGWKGLSVKQQTRIRRQIQDAGAEFTVAKNTLLKKASQERQMEDISSHFKGTTILVSSQNSFPEVAKALQAIIKEYPQVEVKIGVLEGKVIMPEDIKRMASLPSREVLLGQVLSSLISPISLFIQTLQMPLRNLLFVLQEYEKIKQKSQN